MSSKGRSGRKVTGMTKNQRRKAAYEAMSGHDGNRAGSRVKSRNSRDSVSINDHQTGEGPQCWNVGCRRCNPINSNLGLPRNGYRVVKGVRLRQRDISHGKPWVEREAKKV